MGRRLIDTDAAYAVLTDYYHHSTDTQHAALREALGRVESVDAVEVVRCKDCRFSDWYTAVDGKERCYCMEHDSSGHEEMDFCSYGERDSDT